MIKYIQICVILTIPIFGLCQKFNGFFDFEYDLSNGHINLEVPESSLNNAFLYVNSLVAGVGSNDIGLDRGQLGKTRIVKFEKAGNKLLLIQENTKYKAISNNSAEINAVKEAFANAVLWGFEIKSFEEKTYTINITSFLLHDRHAVSQKLLDKKQGNYKPDHSKSAIHIDQTFSFPKNSEFESIITFVGKPEGKFIKEVAIDPNIITVRQHHSFIELPDDQYVPRVFHTSCGYNITSFEDYASPIGTDMTVRYINRHRLEKKRPLQPDGEVIKPITYYLDSGCPEPVKSALLEGASWWNDAFSNAGYKNAFQVKILPEDAHPLDVRYNVIQWIHRKTRGWSYGASIVDPRTGEIIKGHVSLGSLRVRQDFMIAQGIHGDITNSNHSDIMDMALARLRQLSAHEVGHTIGLTHNFAASYNNRSSVMDYPHPLITLDKTSPDFTNAYSKGIGEWDKRVILYGYSEIPTSFDEKKYLKEIIASTKADGLKFITDQDARPKGGLHPTAHLWDNGTDPIGELNRISTLRHHSLKKFNSNVLSKELPLSELEKILVPIYLMHRYQVEAVSKLIGGLAYDYTMNAGQSSPQFEIIDHDKQKEALNAILQTLESAYLTIPKNILNIIPPPAYGYKRDRESFSGHTGLQLDPLGAAEALVNHCFTFLLEPSRLSRIKLHDQKKWRLHDYFHNISKFAFELSGESQTDLIVQKLLYIHLLKLAKNQIIDKQVIAEAQQILTNINLKYLMKNQMQRNTNPMQIAHQNYLLGLHKMANKDIQNLTIPSFPKMPPGSPIGCDR